MCVIVIVCVYVCVCDFTAICCYEGKGPAVSAASLFAESPIEEGWGVGAATFALIQVTYVGCSCLINAIYGIPRKP